MNKSILIPGVLLLTAAIGVAVLYRAEAARSSARLADALREIERLRAAPAMGSERPTPTDPAAGTVQASPSAARMDPEALLAQLQEFERLMQESEPGPTVAPQNGSASAGSGTVTQSPRNWMEDLKKTDPARYEEMVRQREQARQEMLAARAEQSDFFLNRAEESQAAEEQAHYQQIAQLLDSTWQMMEMLRANLPEEQRREMRTAIRDNLRTLSPLLAAERNKEWRRLGQELGATEAESKVIADRINQVLRVTNARDLLRHRSGGGGSGSRPEPGRGGR